VCRLVERSIKDSECIDLESLTLIAGEQVWSICCDIRILSFHGNIIDATNLAVVSMDYNAVVFTFTNFDLYVQMSALRAFRKPEVSISLSEDIQSNTQQSYTTRNLKLYTGDEREPLPLALHHTPLTVSIVLFCLSDTAAATSEDASKGGLLFVCDPSRQEELAMDGQVSFSVNSHRCDLSLGAILLLLPALAGWLASDNPSIGCTVAEHVYLCVCASQ
jgi:exosome complex component RRP45